MKEIKTTRTIEEITGYEAMDGTIFRSKEACEKYESSAKSAAKAAAWHYLVDKRGSYDVFDSEENYLIVFDIPDMNAYLAIRTWAEHENVYDLKGFTPDYIGKRTAFYESWDCIHFNKVYATKEAMLEFYTKEIEYLFSDKKTDPQ